MNAMKNQRDLTRMRDAELLRDYRRRLGAAMESGEEINRMKIIEEVLPDFVTQKIRIL